MTAPPWTMLREGPGYALVRLGDVFLNIWGSGSVPTPEILGAFVDETIRAKRDGRRLAVVCVVDAGSVPPDDACRREGARVLAHVDAFIVVHEDDGLWASIVRTIATGTAFVMRARHVRVVPSVADAVTAARALGVAATDDLGEVTRRLRLALPPVLAG